MKTILYDRHHALGAQFVDFGGWEMPLQYCGIIEEHHTVRNQVGLFDVSHMGRIEVQGVDAEPFLDYLSANRIAGRQPCSAMYTVLCNASGGTVDDTIIYKMDTTHYFMIANASNRSKDLTHLRQYSASFDVTMTPRYDEEGILAIQGPNAQKLIHSLFPTSVQLSSFMHFMVIQSPEGAFILSTTGYTGTGWLRNLCSAFNDS